MFLFQLVCCKASKFVQLSYCGPDTGDEWSVMPVAVLQHETSRQAEAVAKPSNAPPSFTKRLLISVNAVGVQLRIWNHARPGASRAEASLW